MEWGMGGCTGLTEARSQRDWITIDREMAIAARKQSERATDLEMRAYCEELATQWTLFAEAAAVEFCLSEAR